MVFFILPAQFGKGSLTFIRIILRRGICFDLGFWGDHILFFNLGFILLFLDGSLMNLLGIFSLYNLIIMSIPVILLGARGVGPTRHITFPLHLYPFSASIFLGLSGLFLLRARIPFPFQKNFDIFQNLFVIGRIIEYNEFHVFVRDYSQLGFHRFNFNALNLLYALSMKWSGSDPVSFFWSAPIIQIVLFSIFIYLMAFYFSNDRHQAILAVFIGTWIFETTGPSGIWQFLDDQLLMLIFPLMLVISDSRLMENKFPMAVILGGALVIHPFVGLVFIGIFFLYISLKRILELDIFDRKVLVLITLFISILVLVMGTWDIFKELSIDPFKILDMEGKSLNTIEKFNRLIRWNSWMVILGSLGGALMSSLAYGKTRNRLSSLAALYMILLLFYFSPVAYSFRTLVFIHPLIGFFTAYFIARWLDHLSIDSQIGQYIRPIMAVTLVYLLLISLPLSSNILGSKKSIWGSDESSFTGSELKMARWITDNTSPETILISETIEQQVKVVL